MTFESLLAGPTFARCAFKGALRGTKLDSGLTDERHVYILYIRRILHSSTISVGLAQARPNKEDFAQQYDKCGARSGSPQLYWKNSKNNHVKGVDVEMIKVIH